MNCPKCSMMDLIIPMIGIEYEWSHPEHYDGISEWKCVKCNIRIGRWSGKCLVGDEYEFRFGGREYKKTLSIKPIGYRNATDKVRNAWWKYKKILSNTPSNPSIPSFVAGWNAAMAEMESLLNSPTINKEEENDN